MNETIKRVYVDTSVVYGAPDKSFAQVSKRFWDTVREGKIIIIVSDVLIEEIDRAPDKIRALLDSVPDSQIQRFVATTESNRLAKQYITENVVGESSLDDCRHIALATIAQADTIVSWNFKHIVNRRDGYNKVNKKLGYPEIAIQNPKQFMEEYDVNTEYGNN